MHQATWKADTINALIPFILSPFPPKCLFLVASKQIRCLKHGITPLNVIATESLAV